LPKESAVTAIVNFDPLPAPSASAPAADRVRSGDPRQLIWNLLSSADGHFHVGQWASGVGAWEVQYTEFELCHILTGVVRVSDAQGFGRLYRTGDTFVIPSGFRGTWEVIEPCRKIYAIYELRT
jgi:uncharacterized cupin superfamily protein